jgi:hypothetical protein
MVTKIWTIREDRLLKIAREVLPKFTNLPPDEAAKAALTYAKALLKELEDE